MPNADEDTVRMDSPTTTTTTIGATTTGATYTRIKGISIKPRTFVGLPFFLFGAMLATQSFDGNSILGNVSLVYQFGFWTGAILPIGFALSLLLTGFLYGRKS